MGMSDEEDKLLSCSDRSLDVVEDELDFDSTPQQNQTHKKVNNIRTSIFLGFGARRETKRGDKNVGEYSLVSREGKLWGTRQQVSTGSYML